MSATLPSGELERDAEGQGLSYLFVGETYLRALTGSDLAPFRRNPWAPG